MNKHSLNNKIPSIKIITDKPLALDSRDHIRPWGTAHDNSINLKFNKKLFRVISSSELKVLDLGCAGGGFVRSILDDGGFAVGVEGSDYSKKIGRAEWGKIPGRLFTADITEPFQFMQMDQNGKDREIKFNLITAWEVLEHIREDQLVHVFKNIQQILSPSGIIMVSISASKGVLNEVRYHQTIRKRKWWLKKILELGFLNHETAVLYFGGDWIRGWYDLPVQFHFVLTRIDERSVIEQKMSLLPLSIKFRTFISGLITPLIFLLATIMMSYDKKGKIL